MCLGKLSDDSEYGYSDDKDLMAWLHIKNSNKIFS